MECRTGHQETGKELLEQRQRQSRPNKKAGLELLEGCRRNDINLVLQALAKGPSVDIQDSDGYTPLHVCAENGNIMIVRVLLTHDADVNMQDYSGYTPLHLCASKGKVEIVKLLLANKAGVNIKNKFGGTPLHYSVRYNHVEIVKVLLAHSADISVKCYFSLTPLMIAIIEGHELLVEYLLQNGATLDTDCNEQDFLLRHAQEGGYSRICSILQCTTTRVSFTLRSDSGANTVAPEAAKCDEITSRNRNERQPVNGANKLNSKITSSGVSASATSTAAAAAAAATTTKDGTPVAAIKTVTAQDSTKLNPSAPSPTTASKSETTSVLETFIQMVSELAEKQFTSQKPESRPEISTVITTSAENGDPVININIYNVVNNRVIVEQPKGVTCQEAAISGINVCVDGTMNIINKDERTDKGCDNTNKDRK